MDGSANDRPAGYRQGRTDSGPDAAAAIGCRRGLDRPAIAHLLVLPEAVRRLVELALKAKVRYASEA